MVSEFTIRSRRFRLSAATVKDISAIKRLDDVCFQPHRGSTIEELHEVMFNGLILVIHHGTNLLAMTQLVLGHCSLLPFELPGDEMFSYGTGIHPAWRGCGLANVLMSAQKDVALRRGKQSISSTTRVENAASLTMRFRAGFRLVSFIPRLFPGEGVNGNRVVMRWRTPWTPQPIPHYREVLSVFDATAEGVSPEAWFIPIMFGNVPDTRAQELIKVAIETKRVGIGIIRCCAATKRGGLVFSHS